MSTYTWNTGLLVSAGGAKETAAIGEIDAEARACIDNGDWAALEDLLMTRLEDATADAAPFPPVLRLLVRRKQLDRAELWLQLIRESLMQRQDIPGDVALLKATLNFWPECAAARSGLLDHLRTLYAGTPNLERIVKHVDVLHSADPLPALQRLEAWLRYDEGRWVYMPTRGVGSVREINLPLGVVRVKFVGGPELLSVRLQEAQRLMEALPHRHFLAETAASGPELRELAERDPGEILRRLFVSAGRPLGAAEMKEMLGAIVPAAGWNAWWGRAKGDLRLTVGPGTAPVCTWSDSAAAAGSEIVKQFTAGSPREKLEMLRKHAARSADLAAVMAADLASAAQGMLTSDRALALEILLTLEKIADVKVGAAVREIIEGGGAGEMVRSLGDRLLRKRGVSLVKEWRPDWRALFLLHLDNEGDMQIFAYLYGALNDDASRDELMRTVRDTLADPGRAPRFYLWLCRGMTERAELTSLGDVVFLRQLLASLADPALKEQHAALRKLFDAGALADHLIGGIDVEGARQLLAALGRDSALEEYRKERLRTGLRVRFPELREEEATAFYVTAEAIARKREEFDRLNRVDIPQNTEEMRTAKAHGDLRENFEYHAARARQEMLSSRNKTLHDELKCARAIDPSRVDASSVAVGTRVVLRPAGGGGGEELALTILGPWDSDPANDIVSYLAPAVTALLGATVGTPVSFNDKPYVVEAIAVWTAG